LFAGSQAAEVHFSDRGVSADVTLAAQHAAFLSGYLEGEHVDPKHEHLDVYEPLDWADSK
jgi:hypothetical protein